jgi:hypothetical protein
MVILVGSFVLAVIIVLSTLTALIYFSYSIPKRLGNERLGKILALVVISSLLFIGFRPAINRTFFTEYYATKRLKDQGFNLTADMKIVDWEGSDWYDKIQIQISESNQMKLIETLRNHRNFDGSIISDNNEIGIRHSSEKTIDTTVIRRYEKGFYYHHFYKEPGYAFHETEIKLDTIQQMLNYTYYSD